MKSVFYRQLCLRSDGDNRGSFHPLHLRLHPQAAGPTRAVVQHVLEPEQDEEPPPPHAAWRTAANVKPRNAPRRAFDAACVASSRRVRLLGRLQGLSERGERGTPVRSAVGLAVAADGELAVSQREEARRRARTMTGWPWLPLQCRWWWTWPQQRQRQWRQP